MKTYVIQNKNIACKKCKHRKNFAIFTGFCNFTRAHGFCLCFFIVYIHDLLYKMVLFLTDSPAEILHSSPTPTPLALRARCAIGRMPVRSCQFWILQASEEIILVGGFHQQSWRKAHNNSHKNEHVLVI